MNRTHSRLDPARSAAVGSHRPARARTVLTDPTRPASLRVFPALLDSDLDGPVVPASPRRPIAARLVGVLGQMGLALSLAAGYPCGLRLYANLSPPEDGALRAPAGLFGLFLIAVRPAFSDEWHG